MHKKDKVRSIGYKIQNNSVVSTSLYCDLDESFKDNLVPDLNLKAFEVKYVNGVKEAINYHILNEVIALPDFIKDGLAELEPLSIEYRLKTLRYSLESLSFDTYYFYFYSNGKQVNLTSKEIIASLCNKLKIPSSLNPNKLYGFSLNKDYISLYFKELSVDKSVFKTIDGEPSLYSIKRDLDNNLSINVYVVK